MEKRYQVFISSTYQDLQPARQEVSQALLRADCFPAGMELFPAADEEQFEFIKQIIDQSDYYIIISAGRYGSIHPETGLSYTEMEYDYAVETGKPVIRLLHKDPFNQLKGEFIEKTDDGREKLTAFRAKMSTSSLVRFWEIPKELGIEVVFGLQDLIRRNEAIGWVRGDAAIDVDEALNISRLRASYDELRSEHLELQEKLVRFEASQNVDSDKIPVTLPSLPRKLENTYALLNSIFDGDDKKTLKIIADCFIWISKNSQKDSFNSDWSQFNRTNFLRYVSDSIGVSIESALGVITSLRADKISLRRSDIIEQILKLGVWSSWASDYSDALEAWTALNPKTPPRSAP